MEENKEIRQDRDANPDPITGEPGAHPVGTGIGAAGIGAAGTAIGAAVGGPVGAVVGAVVGSVAGGLAGKGVAEQIDPTVEEAYWRDNHRSRPYFEDNYDYDRDYSPAYRTGYDGYSSNAGGGETFEAAEPRLRENYEKQRGESRLDWDKAKPATQDAWNRSDFLVKGYRDNDEYWRSNHQSRPYAKSGRSYDDYESAYRSGYSSYQTYGRDRGMTYEQAEPEIRSRYERENRDGLGWDDAKNAVQDAWHRAKDSVTDNDRHRSYR
ncbi:MAG: glycine zipper family protein [Elainellaceae cyanobacterium]